MNRFRVWCKKRNARHVTVDQIAGFCKHHEEVLRFRTMAKKDCLHCNAETRGKCKYLIDRDRLRAQSVKTAKQGCEVRED